MHHKPWIIINIICPQILLDDAFLIHVRYNWQIQEVDFTYEGKKKNKLKLISLKPIMGDGHADEKPPAHWSSGAGRNPDCGETQHLPVQDKGSTDTMAHCPALLL